MNAHETLRTALAETEEQAKKGAVSYAARYRLISLTLAQTRALLAEYDTCRHDMLREVCGWVADVRRAEFGLMGNLRNAAAINGFTKHLCARIDDALLHEVAPKEEATDA